MKRILILAAALTVVLLSGAQTAESLLGAAIHQEEAEGNLTAAIAGYKKVLAQYGSNHAVAAKAQLRLGACYERLGDADARKAYESVIRNYGDQTEIVTQARARLAALGRPAVPGGLAVRQVWADPGGSLMGAVSLDGRYLTATDWKTGDLAIRDLTTGEMRHVTSNKSPADGNAEFSAPSPDGKRIAYGWYRQQHGDLRVINVDGSGMRVLYSDPQVRYVELSAWSPDGKHVLGVLQKDHHQRNEMVLIGVSDGSVRVLKTGGFPHFDDMQFSPDGRFILYSAPQQSARDSDVYVMASDGSYDGPLVAHPANDHVLGWTPDGHYALFSSNRTGVTSAWRIRVADGKPQGPPELIRMDLGAVRSMGVTRQGSLYYGLAIETKDVYTAEINSENGAIVTPPSPVAKRFTGGNSRGQWSPDGDLLAYQATRTGGDDQAVVIHEMKTGRERVFAPQIPNLFLNSWLPDGSGLIVGANVRQAGPALQKIDARTGELSSGSVPNPQSRDGKWSFRWEAAALHARNVSTGEDRVIYSGNPDNCCRVSIQPSPDSTRLAAAIDNKLVVISLPGGESRELLALADGERFAAPVEGAVTWLGNQHLLFTKLKGDASEFWRVAAGGGAAQKIDLGIRQVSELRVHPDGRRIAFTAGSGGKSEVWVMENFLSRSAQ